LAKNLDELIDEISQIQADSPPIPAFAAKEAKANIDGGKADYTDVELKAASG
jgi:hypothetical protein